MSKHNLGNRLFWKISAILLLVFVLVGFVYIFNTANNANIYVREMNQRLYGGIAQHLVDETHPLSNGKIDTAAAHDIMHSMMVINPSVEVYLLDTTGKIIDYVVPFNTVKRKSVAIEPLHKFLESKGEKYIEGEDPKSDIACNVFSAAPIIQDGQLEGYAYIILAGQEQTEIASTLLNSYVLKTGTYNFLIALLASLLFGMLAIWLITRNLSKIIDVVKRFKEGDLTARIPNAEQSDLKTLATTYNSMADTIVANIDELKSIENLRRELIANVSHDLRTPLAVIQGYVETVMLKEETISSEDRLKYLNIALGSSEKLCKLIGQLFEYSKLEAKQLHPQKEAFFISDLAQDLVQKYQILASEKNIILDLEMPEKLPMVFADVSMVDRILQNLIDNALKFTPNNGKVCLMLNQTHDFVKITVLDNGPGISEQEQTAIFERYQKASNNSRQRSGGAGLGLAIVKKMLELHDATIHVKSRLNEGTSFFFELPAYANA